jgi:serine/threonine protein kinase
MIPFEFLGPYRISEPIGRGGMGTVYRAVHEKTGQPVAVKVIAMHVADDPRFRRRFADEVETLKRLKHRNIVTLIGYGEQNGHLFYSMELVSGESLQQILRREKRLGWPMVLDMAIDICAALKHAHDFGVIHRDLKPANLLIDQQGSVKLVDFGIAKLFGNHGETAAGSVLGTADFMAPEQAGEGAITPRTDLYSLGNVLYACFAGRPPFAGRTLTRVIESLRQEEPARIDLIVPELPQEIAELVHDLLEKRPEDRPPTALAVMNRLKAIRAGLKRAATRLDIADSGQESQPGDSLTPAADRPTSVSSGDSGTAANDLSLVTSPTDPAPAPDPAAATGVGGSTAGNQLTVEATVPSKSASAGSRRPAAAEALPQRAQTDGDSWQSAPQTHYRTVEDHDRHRSFWSGDGPEERPASKWWHLLSIVVMITALLAGAGALIWATRRPSADELYRDIVQAQASNDRQVLEKLADRFVRLYPDDPRRDEVDTVFFDRKVARVITRLRVAATLGGVDQLPPDEQAFLRAIEDLEQDPLITRTRLQHWLNVYSPAAETTESAMSQTRRDMIDAAQSELERLRAQPLPQRDQRVDELLRRIAWGQENLPPESQRKLLEGIVSLFANKLWAQPAIEEARRQLAEIDR